MNDAANSSADKATLTYPGGTADFPILTGTDGADSIDLSTLTRQTGYTALDNGFVNTASTTPLSTTISRSAVSAVTASGAAADGAGATGVEVVDLGSACVELGHLVASWDLVC
mgnify:CR=1 FL=1